jgi:antitoxin component YwqK of YwqJK toxin-antitoxin module
MPLPGTAVGTLLLLVASVANCYAQEEYPSVTCAAKQRLKAIFQYDIDATPGMALPARRLIEGYFYDRAGHHTQWQQYEAPDSTQFSTRTFTYDGPGHVIKLVDLSADKADGTIDSVRTDANGLVTYRRMFRPSGQVLMEAFYSTELNQRQQPVKSSALNVQKQVQGYTLYTYNAANQPVRETTYSAQQVLAQQRTYTYYPTGTLKRTAEIRASHDTLVVKKFGPTGLLVEEVHFNQEGARGTVDYKILKKYDAQQREIEALTYSTDYSANDKLTVSRREVSQYGASCLKSKTLIYTTAPFAKEEKLQVIFAYRYAYYE